MAFSRVTKIGDGVSTQFPVNFTLGYIDSSHITARVGNEVDGLGNPVYRTVTFLGPNLLQISGAPAGIGVKIVFERTVPKDKLLVDFSNGDVLDDVNLDISQLQTIMAVQEVLDGRFSTLSQDLDFGNWTGTNTRTPINPTDLANKEYVDSATGFLAVNIPLVQAQLDAAVTDTVNAKNVAQASATAAEGSAAAAAASAASINITSINALINTKYDKAGGTLTGDSTILKTNPALTLDKTASGQFNRLRGQTNGILRWDLVLGDDSAEGGSNAGSIFAINRYSDAGVLLGSGMTIRRTDGYTTIPGNVEVGSPGVDRFLYARRQSDRGGQVTLEKPTGSSIAGNGVSIDVQLNTLRIFEDSGTNRGLNYDITTCAGGVGSVGIHSGNLGAQLAALAVDAIGSFGFFRESGASSPGPGNIVAGSTIVWTSQNDATSVNGANPSGNWRRHGQGFNGGATLFRRVS